ncbi:MGDG synthase family glycosyltransferase [Paenibacillus sp. A14]|uniref:MGDG synthase family glycosyltransferase n=1 Tax=Paenibacillus sp. A14 TaxID=3119820 RepID=UPI002FE31E56
MNAKTPKIMILYASYGDGHYRASKAIEAGFRSRGIRDVVLLDLMAEAHPRLNELTKFIYLTSFKALPSLYGWIYNVTKDLRIGATFLRAVNSIGSGTLKKAISRHQPDLVIHTFPQLALPDLIERASLSLPLVNVITDFDVHARWLHAGVDRYYVATEDMKREMIERGVPEERVLVSGIPLRPDFRCDGNSPAVSGIGHALNPNKKTILLMAGASGVMQGNRDICEALLAGGNYQVLAVCGRNEELYQKLALQFGDHPDFHLFGFVDEVAEFMLASDCIITKPGGITLSEALACRLPLFLYRPVPGQELNNARYLESKGIARIARDPRSLHAGIDALLQDSRQLARVSANMENLRKPMAAEVIVNDILDQWFQPASCKPSPVQIGSAHPRLVIH